MVSLQFQLLFSQPSTYCPQDPSLSIKVYCCSCCWHELRPRGYGQNTKLVAQNMSQTEAYTDVQQNQGFYWDKLLGMKAKLYSLHPSNNLEHSYIVDHKDKIEMGFFFFFEKKRSKYLACLTKNSITIGKPIKLWTFIQVNLKVLG